jgi:hypothetical protein
MNPSSMALKSESTSPHHVVCPPPIQKYSFPLGSWARMSEPSYTRRPRRVTRTPLSSAGSMGGMFTLRSVSCGNSFLPTI